MGQVRGEVRAGAFSVLEAYRDAVKKVFAEWVMPDKGEVITDRAGWVSVPSLKWEVRPSVHYAGTSIVFRLSTRDSFDGGHSRILSLKSTADDDKHVRAAEDIGRRLAELALNVI